MTQRGKAEAPASREGQGSYTEGRHTAIGCEQLNGADSTQDNKLL